jgi:hypothetical protein
VAVSGGTVTGGIDGGDAGLDYSSGLVTANGNDVSISGGAVTGEIRGGYAGSVSGSASAAGNTVTVSGGAVLGDVHGGIADGNLSDIAPGLVTATTTASENEVSISGGAMTGDVYGGWAWSVSGTATADKNTVTVSGGTVTGAVYGGYAHSEDTKVSASASDNTVIISGNAVLQGPVYGGYVNSSRFDRSEGNKIIIYGTPTMKDAKVFGGYVKDAVDAAQFKGNTLVTATDKTLQLDKVEQVENFEFVLPANAGDGYVALEAADSIIFGDGKGNKSRVSSISIRGGGGVLQPGDELTLFKAKNLNTTDLLTSGTRFSGRKGISLLYEYKLSGDGTLTVSKVRLNPQTKALSEGQAAGLAFLTHGSDLIAGGGMKAAVSGAGAAHGLSAFAAVSGGRSRYDTGSHVDVSGVSVLAGLAFGADLDPGRLTVGAFFEGGWGSYDTYNSFRNYASVDGDGDTSYVGGGILGRFDSKPLGPGKAYVEASARMGASTTDFSSTDLADDSGRHARYDLETTYYGLHAGVGYVWQITEAAALDLSGKYFWTRQGSDSMHIAGDPVKFDAVDSHRLRAGGRLTLAVTEHVSPYIGAAYEHELAGEAEAKAYGRRISSPDLSGPTGIGEIGLTLLGGEKAPLSLDLGVQGYTGTREGVTGSLQMKLSF